MKKSITQNGSHPYSERGEKGGEGEKGVKCLNDKRGDYLCRLEKQHGEGKQTQNKSC